MMTLSLLLLAPPRRLFILRLFQLLRRALAFLTSSGFDTDNRIPTSLANLPLRHTPIRRRVVDRVFFSDPSYQ